MKKQILILALFVMAIFASVTNSYAQPGHLTPTPGTLYNYAPTITATPGSSLPVYSWKVIDASVSSDLIGGATIPAVNTYFTPGVLNAASIDITWTAAAVTKTFYLVLTYSETSSLTGCTVSNMKSYEIKPMSTLLLAVTRTNLDGTPNLNTDICPPTIATATVVSGSPSVVTYTYNPTVLYYKVNASGMDGNWRPSLLLPALAGSANGQVYASVKVATTAAPVAGDYVAFTGTLANVTTAGTGMVSTADWPVTVAGKDYFIEVTITNAKYESLAAQPIALAADGFLPTAYAISDIVGGGNYANEVVFGKSVSYNILPRPTIVPAVTVPASPFIQQAP